jgi:D-alanyl-D-alanine carboxypeptidase
MRTPHQLIDRRSALRIGGLAGLSAVLAACSSPTVGSDPAPRSPSAQPSTPTPAPSASTGGFTLDGATRSTLDTIFDQQLAASGLAGMGQDSWTRSAGYADLAAKTPYRPDDHVRIASITKSYTASTVLRLADAGRLKLDDVLETYVPGIANGAKITIEQLLGMTSGVFDFTSDQTFLDAFDADPELPWTDADTLKIIKANKPSFAPGAELQYCDSNYALLGMIVALVTGTSTAAAITEQVISKLSLPGTLYPTDASLPDPHPVGYVPGGKVTDPNAPFDNSANPPKDATKVNPAVPGGAGAMISTLDDLGTWGHELAAGTLLDPATQTRRLKAQRFPGVPINLGYGLGCEVLNDFVGHNGAILGFSSVVMRDPKTDVTLAAVGNESTNFTTPTATWSYAVIKELFPSQWR